MRIPHDSLIVVADGRKLLFLRNEGDAEQPVFRKVSVKVQQNPKDSDQKTDLAGRAPGGGATGTNSMGEADFHQLEEDRFAADAAELLKQRAMHGDFTNLIVVAPARTLGELRKHYHKEVSDRLSAEVAKDLVNHPVDEIERILVASD